jgi:hypothetical protein
MLCFRDRSYCVAECYNNDCKIKFEDAKRERAESPDGFVRNLPICVVDYSVVCEGYEPKEK